MNREYWDRMADNYEAEVFDVYKNDKAGLVISKVSQYGAAGKKASDIGCGIGIFLPALSSIFHEVFAVDISPKCIAKAKAKHSNLTNVTYTVADLTKPRARLPMVDFTLAVNSIITPSLTRRSRILDAICSHLRPRGLLVMVAPSLESKLLACLRRIEWDLRDGIAPSCAARAGFRAHKDTDSTSLYEGIVKIDNVATKHYIKEELVILMNNRGMEVVEIQKIEYTWKSEFLAPPRWMKGPFPWDWLCVAQKKRRALGGREGGEIISL